MGGTGSEAADGLPAGARIRTVLGDIPAAEFGACNYHDHLFHASRLLPGEDLDDEVLSTAEARLLVASGIAAMVDATPTGLGRRPASVARISAGTGLRVVHVTGAHHEDHYEAGHWLVQLSSSQLARRFRSEVEDGIIAVDGPANGPLALGPTGDPVRAGMVKAGVGYWRISHFEHRVLEAAAAASASGVPVMVHLEFGSAAWEVLAILEAAGVPASRVVLAHLDRNLDPGFHAELAASGVYLGYDQMARHRQAPDVSILDCLSRYLAQGGDIGRILLGADVARRSRFLSYGGLPGLAYLGDRFVPRMVRRFGDAAVQQILVANPARVLALAPANP